jgi:transposase
MQQALYRSSLVPHGFVVESAYYEGDRAVIAVRASGSVGLCPSCGTVSRRVHSRYRRRVTDLPLSGRIVELLMIARRFRCDAVLCGRQIFTERFADFQLPTTLTTQADPLIGEILNQKNHL